MTPVLHPGATFAAILACLMVGETSAPQVFAQAAEFSTRTEHAGTAGRPHQIDLGFRLLLEPAPALSHVPGVPSHARIAPRLAFFPTPEPAAPKPNLVAEKLADTPRLASSWGIAAVPSPVPVMFSAAVAPSFAIAFHPVPLALSLAAAPIPVPLASSIVPAGGADFDGVLSRLSRPAPHNDLRTVSADIEASSNQPLTLMQAIQIALTNPTQRFKWQVQQDQANQAVSLAKSSLLPQLSTVASANLLSTNNILTPDPQGSSISDARQRVGLAASYPLFDDGLLYDKRKIAEAEALATSATIQSDQHATVTQTVNAFFGLLEAQRIYDSQKTALASATELYKTAQAQYQVGTVAKVDVLTANSTYEAAVNQADQSADNLIIARGTLAQTLGEDPSRFVPSVSVPAALPALSKPLDAITTEALSSAPARNVLTDQRVAEQAKLSAVRAQKSPTVNLTGGVGYAAGAYSGRSDSGYSYVTLNLSVPLFDNQAQRASERAAADSIQLTDNAIQTTDTATRLAVIQDYTLYQSSLPQIDAAQASSDAADAALDLAQKEYAVGKGSLSQVELALAADDAASLQSGSALDRRDSAIISLELLTGELDTVSLAKPAAQESAAQEPGR